MRAIDPSGFGRRQHERDAEAAPPMPGPNCARPPNYRAMRRTIDSPSPLPGCLCAGTSVASATSGCVVPVPLFALHVPEASFTSMTFRIRTVIATAILSARKAAHAAFRAADVCGYVRVTGIDHRTVVVSSDCAYCRLVVLDIRLDGNRYGGVSG
ncbi:hypothetical protein [Burkholderia sp. BCC1993]|uniref:hypothetical protein n=1 Tax=Burkholderia sp. BCC1993 TaxID=2817444 RepID=UPI002AB0B320|nr:hypothetical protein [Burkholderia sp. BCC1993]